MGPIQPITRMIAESSERGQHAAPGRTRRTIRSRCFTNRSNEFPKSRALLWNLTQKETMGDIPSAPSQHFMRMYWTILPRSYRVAEAV
jgi:hypothetical protein